MKQYKRKMEHYSIDKGLLGFSAIKKTTTLKLLHLPSHKTRTTRWDRIQLGLGTHKPKYPMMGVIQGTTIRGNPYCLIKRAKVIRKGWQCYMLAKKVLVPVQPGIEGVFHL